MCIHYVTYIHVKSNSEEKSPSKLEHWLDTCKKKSNYLEKLECVKDMKTSELQSAVG